MESINWHDWPIARTSQFRILSRTFYCTWNFLSKIVFLYEINIDHKWCYHLEKFEWNNLSVNYPSCRFVTVLFSQKLVTLIRIQLMIKRIFSLRSRGVNCRWEGWTWNVLRWRIKTSTRVELCTDCPDLRSLWFLNYCTALWSENERILQILVSNILVYSDTPQLQECLTLYESYSSIIDDCDLDDDITI